MSADRALVKAGNLTGFSIPVQPSTFSERELWVCGCVTSWTMITYKTEDLILKCLLFRQEHLPLTALLMSCLPWQRDSLHCFPRPLIFGEFGLLCVVSALILQTLESSAQVLSGCSLPPTFSVLLSCSLPHTDMVEQQHLFAALILISLYLPWIAICSSALCRCTFYTLLFPPLTVCYCSTHPSSSWGLFAAQIRVSSAACRIFLCWLMKFTGNT